jgi:hypothetical protein
MRQAPADPPLGQRIFSCFPAMGVMSPLLQVLRLPLVVRADLPAIALGPIVEHLKMLGN